MTRNVVLRTSTVHTQTQATMIRAPVMRNGVVKSMGRTSVTAPQSVVVLTALADVDVYSARLHANKRAYFSNATVGAYDILKGELGFGSKGGLNLLVTPHSTYAPSIKISTCFNGFNEKDVDSMVFVGVVDKGFSFTQPGGDDSVTMRVAGTHTIVNTGDEPIPAMSLVYWTTPSINIDGKPRIQVRGVDSSKFYAKLVAIRVTDTQTMFAKFTNALIENFDDALRSGGANAPDFDEHKHSRSGLTVASIRGTLLDLGVEEKLVNAYESAVRILVPDQGRGGQNGGSMVIQRDFETVLGVLLLEEQDKLFNGGVFNEAHPFGGNGVLPEYCARVRERTVMAYNDRLASRTIGRALSSAAAGQQFDIRLGVS